MTRPFLLETLRGESGCGEREKSKREREREREREEEGGSESVFKEEVAGGRREGGESDGGRTVGGGSREWAREGMRAHHQG